MKNEIDELKSIILRSDPAEMVNWFKGKTDAERSKLVQPIQKFQDDITYNWHKKGSGKVRVSAELKKLGFKKVDDIFYSFEAHVPPFVCIDLATLSATKLKAFCLDLTGQGDKKWGRAGEWDAAYLQVLQDRGLKKIDAVVEALLASNRRDGGGEISAAFLLSAIEQGIVTQPSSDDYLICLTDIFDDDYRNSWQAKRDQKLVSENMAFLQHDAYRILQLDSDLLWNDGKASFKQVYRKLMMTGRLKRARVLESLVRALFLDFKKNILQATIKFLQELKPKPDELLALLSDLRGLLASQHSFVCKFGFQSLKDLHEKNRISDSEVLESLSPVFRCPVKGTPKSAITLIKKICKSNPDCIPYGVNTVLAGLGHCDSEIQAAALAWLKSVKSRLHNDHLTTIQESIPGLAATNRKSAREIANAIDSSEPKTNSANSIATSNPKTASLNDSAVLSRSVGYAPTESISGHEELIDAIAHALEVTERGVDAERILDGISRLGVIPTDLEQRAAPVMARAIEASSNFRGSEVGRGLSSAPDATPRMRRVICLYLGAKKLLEPVPDLDEEDARNFGMGWPLKAEPMYLPSYEPANFVEQDGPGYVQRALNYAWRSRLLWQRLEVIENRLKTGEKLPLLSAPTHEHGRIAPSALVDRLLLWQDAEPTIDHVDLILALLRLLPVDRSRALKKLAKLDESLRPVLILAMEGDSSKIAKLKGVDAALMNVAAHIRQTVLDDAEVRRLKLAGNFVNSKMPMLKSWRVNEEKTAKSIRSWNIPFVHIDFEQPKWIAEHPVLSEVYRNQYLALSQCSVWRIQMDAWNDPVCRDAGWLEVLERMLMRLENGPANNAPNFAFFEALFDPGYVWESTACGAVAVAFLGKDSDASGIALDALHEGLAADRVDDATMGDALTRVFNSPMAKAARFAERYSQVAEFSIEHRKFVARSLEILIHHWCDPGKWFSEHSVNRLGKATDCAPILELYLQTIVELDAGRNDSLLTALQSVDVKGKVAKVVKSIIQVCEQ